MRTNELMVGDWVMLTKTNNENTAIKCDVSTFTIFDVCPERIAPIPLTPEILEKNGFLIHPSGTITCYNYHIITDDGFALKFLGKEVKFSYVHQLQQALRLCGLADLADNFKV